MSVDDDFDDQEFGETRQLWLTVIESLGINSNESFLDRAATPSGEFTEIAENVLMNVPFNNIDPIVDSWLDKGISDVVQIAHVQTGQDYVPRVLRAIQPIGEVAVYNARLVRSWGQENVFAQVTELLVDPQLSFPVKRTLAGYYPNLVIQSYGMMGTCLPIMKQICVNTRILEERETFAHEMTGQLEVLDFPAMDFPEEGFVDRMCTYLKSEAIQGIESSLIAELAERARRISEMSRDDRVWFQVTNELGPIQSIMRRPFTKEELYKGYRVAT